MNKSILALLLIALVAATTAPACTCNDDCTLPVNQPIVISTPPTIAPPACAIPTVTPPVIAPPQIGVPTINAPCIDVPTLTPPPVVAPPVVNPPTPNIPTVNPPVYTPPSLPPQVPPPNQVPTAPAPPVIALPTPPPSLSCGSQSSQFTLSFEYQCRPGVAFQSCAGEVVWNNVIVYSVPVKSSTGADLSDYLWHSVSLSVTIVPGRNSLQFVGAGISDSYGLLIDNVRLIRQGTTTNIVVNGDFSSPNVHGSWGLFTDISGWQGIGIEIGSYNAYGTDSGHHQVCELDGTSNYEITQYFYFNNQFVQVSGGPVAACNNPFPGSTLTYKLEFDWAVRTNGPTQYDTSKGNVLWNNQVIGSLAYTGTTAVSHSSY